MKKVKRISSAILIFALIITMTLPSMSVNGAIKKPSNLGSHHSFVAIDARTGEYLCGDNPDKKVYPASTTKLMTAIVLCENGKLGQKITVKSSVLKKIPKDLSKCGLKAGERYSLGDLLNMILIASAGDATYCAAVGVFGSTKKCVEAMNKKAKKLGLSKTCFDNVGGLDIGDGFKKNYTTAREMAKITRYAMGIDTIKKITAQRSYLIQETNGKRHKVIYNTNKFYSTAQYSRNLYNIIGTKTGTTQAAGYVFSATAVNEKGNEVICVYMGRTSTDKTFSDIRKILDKIYTLSNKGTIKLSTGEIKVTAVKTSYKFEYAKNKKVTITPKFKDKVTGKTLTKYKGKVTFKSSNSRILTVSSKGVVTVNNPGEAYVTVRMYDSAYFRGTSVKIKFDIEADGDTPEEDNTPKEDDTQNPEKETEKTTESKCYNQEEYT